MKTILMRRPRKHRVFRPILSASNSCEHCEVCNDCMEKFAEEAETNRPGHVWRVEDGEIIYLEDAIAERMLGRKLNENETVIHRNGIVTDNRDENLEVVVIPDLDVK